MKITTNEGLIQQRSKIVRWTSLGGLAVLGGGLIASFNEEYYVWALPALVVGFVLANISAYNANRYVKEPRPDQALQKALRGFDNNYSLFHYTAPVSHVLLTPSRLHPFIVKSQDGQITYEGGRWRRNFSIKRILLFFSDEALGNPTREAQADAEKLYRKLSQEFGDELPPIEPIIVFTHPEVNLIAPEPTQDTPDEIPAMKAKDLKKYLRAQPRGQEIDPEQRKELVQFLKGGVE